MFRKIIREIAVFVFFTEIAFYILIWFLLNFLIDIFMGTKITKLILLVQKGFKKYTENITIKIIRGLERRGMWY